MAPKLKPISEIRPGSAALVPRWSMPVLSPPPEAMARTQSRRKIEDGSPSTRLCEINSGHLGGKKTSGQRSRNQCPRRQQLRGPSSPVQGPFHPHPPRFFSYTCVLVVSVKRLHPQSGLPSCFTLCPNLRFFYVVVYTSRCFGRCERVCSSFSVSLTRNECALRHHFC